MTRPFLESRLRRAACMLLLVQATATTTATAATVAETTAAAPVLAASVFERINDVRRQQGLQALQRAGELETLAAEHSDAMATIRRPSHDGFQSRFKRARSRLCVENVAAGYTRARSLVDGWQDSPAHRRNLFEPRVHQLGVAVAGPYVTMFACE